ncbi:MAG: sigma-70 family RNA polymerase sigma factor, partial [Candidatus Dadabacteria bacterium]|nr:sigma-70 family RNA polymerase sigma factor [Candidatus Dadabacteria bacterium]
AFNEIVSRYANKIYGFALRITRNSSDAEEVFQEVFLTLTKKLDTFRGESKFSSWLYRITVNATYMYLRSQKKHESNISLENYYPYDEKGTLMGRVMAKDWSSRPDIIIFSNEALKIIDKSINELPESYRTVFHLKDVEGLSNEEVADILEISIPAVKSRLHRARLFLRDRLSDYFHEWRR